MRPPPADPRARGAHRVLRSAALVGVLLAAGNAFADLRVVAAPGTSDKANAAEKRRADREDENSTDDEARRVSASVDGAQYGRVTYLGARVDVPVFKKFSLIPQAELLHVAAANAADRPSLNSYFGAGLGYHPDDSWSLELSGIFGPTSFGIGSLGGTFALSKELGADWSNDVPPVVDLDLELGVERFQWSDGLGPAGADIIQSFVSAQARIRAGSRLRLTPRAMYFLYDKRVDAARGDRIDGLTVLARIGSFAPRALLGARVGFEVTSWFEPFVDGAEIVYAATIGNATELVGGGRFQVGKSSSITAGGGVLYNRVGGPLVSPGSEGAVPVALAEIEIGF